MNTSEEMIQALKQAGMRITPQRMAICDILAKSPEHPTAQMLFHQVRVKFPTLSLATVYNTLDRLVGMGLINVLGSAGDETAHFDADTSPHINLACITCHSITDVHSAHVPEIDYEVSQVSGFKLLGARMMYYGVCPSCQSKTRETNQTNS